MVSDAELLELQDAGLARLGEIQLAAAEKLHGMIQASEDADEVAALAKAVEGCGRSLRLTYALRVKLRKDIRSLDREEARLAGSQASRVENRAERIRDRVETLTWREADWEDDEDLDTEFDRVLAFESLDPAFADLPLEEQADRLIARLGLKAEYPPGYTPKQPPQRQSSA